MARPPKIKLSPIVYLDTWGGLTVSLSTTGAALDSNLASVRMFFRDSADAVGLELTSADGEITITDANAWTFAVAAVNPFPLAVKKWYWSIETTNVAGIVKTRMIGTKEVIEDATY